MNSKGIREYQQKQISERQLKKLEELVGSEGIEKDPSAVQTFCQDWTKKHKGGGCGIVLLPKNTQQVSSLLAFCNSERIPVVPQGGNTGLVAGGVPLSVSSSSSSSSSSSAYSCSEAVLSLRRLSKIHSIDSVSGIVVTDAGVILVFYFIVYFYFYRLFSFLLEKGKN